MKYLQQLEQEIKEDERKLEKKNREIKTRDSEAFTLYELRSQLKEDVDKLKTIKEQLEMRVNQLKYDT